MSEWKLRAAPRVSIAGSLAAAGDVTSDGSPTWRSGMAVGEWKQLSGTATSNTVPSPAPTGAPNTRITAWNGFAVMDTDVYLGMVGGHGDYAGNEMMRCQLGVNSPGAFTILRAPTTNANLLDNTDEYADGRPTSSHTYYDIFAVPSRNRIFRFGIGSGWGNGSHTTSAVHAYSVAGGDYDSASTWTDIPDTVGRAQAKCQNPTTEDVYVFADSRMYRWSAATATWTALATHIQNGSASYYRSMAFDTTRNRIAVFGDAFRTTTGILIYDVSGDSWSTSDLTGSYAATVAGQSGNRAHYHAGTDRFHVKTNGAGTDVVIVHPTTWATSLMSVSGGSPSATQNGVFGLFQPMPSLGGYVYIALGNEDVWFLATDSI